MAAVIAIFNLGGFTQGASALSGSQFDAGRIIDDGVFYAVSTMSVTDIQAFLNSKVPECDTNGTRIYSGSTTRAAYGTSRGYAPPYTCLKDYSQNVQTVAGDSLCNGTITGNTKTSATIIAEVANACGINPKVLIVLLQKEQSLVTDDWPWSSQYRSATGYGCPDTAPCDSQYYGFFNQVYQAARAYKRYRANPANYNYRVNRNNVISWNPNAGCGTSDVTILTQATAGLYIYTPYRPNQAALNNLYGTGDSCSAYGNRNFWRFYNDWFGSTYAPSYSWQWAGQYAFTDASKTVAKSLANMKPGEKAYIGFKARNTGNVTWTNSGAHPISVGTTGPLQRSSRLAEGSGWLSPSRPTVMKESTVAPGEIGTFEFWITAPTRPGMGGEYDEHFSLLAEGLTWFNDVGLSYYTSVQPATYSWQWAGQYAYTDATKATPKSLNGILPGDRVYVSFVAKNTGNMTWYNNGANPVRVGTVAPLERKSAFKDDTWIGPSRPATMKEASVAPGANGTFEFWMTVLDSPGAHNERFGVVSEGLTWFNDTGLSYGIAVAPKVYSWEWAGQYAYTDSNMTTPKDLNTLTPGERVYVGVRAKNTGNITWSNTGANPLRIGTSSPLERTSGFYDSSWVSQKRPAVMKETSVAPGQTGTFEFWMTAPATKGAYNEKFNLLSEGAAWLKDIGLSYGIKVQ